MKSFRRLGKVLIFIAVVSLMISASVSMLSVKAQTPANSSSNSRPCTVSQRTELSKVNSQAAIIQAQNSLAFRTELPRFTDVQYNSAYEVIHWDSLASCLPLSEIYTVVFSAYNSSGFAGYLHVSEIPTSLAVIGVLLQTEQAKFDYCTTSPCNTPIWAGWEGWNNNRPGAPYPGNCSSQCNTVYEADSYFYQPTPSYPPTGCNDYYHCEVGVWVGLADQEGATDQNLAQAGTTAQCVLGRYGSCILSYWAWYELFPATAVQCTGMVINGGDRIYASTTNQAWVGGNDQLYRFSIDDYSTNTFCDTQYMQYPRMTTPYWADYIVEWPKIGCDSLGFNCASLAQFGTVPFSSAEYYCASGAYCYPNAHTGEIGLWQGSYNPNTNFKLMINECGCQSGGVLDVDTGLVSFQDSFTETWDSSYGT